MPGKHAPPSPKSYYVSLARSFGGVALALIVLVVIIAVVAGGDGGRRTFVAPTPTPTPSISGTQSPEPTGSPSDTPTTDEKPELLDKEELTLDVFNGTRRGGLARRVSQRLAEEGYKIGDIDTADPVDTTTIYYRERAEAEAQRLLDEHDEFGRIKPAETDTPGGGDITIVLGDDYERNN